VHAPAPSQVEAAVAWFVATLHVGALHTVPRAYFWQTPPWHLPVVPQLVGPMSLQTPAGSALPVGVFVHVPTVPASAQDWHDPLQAELQHTPWAQKADWHSVPAEHDAPSGFLPHWLPLHTRGDWQFASLVHAAKQVLPLQTYGEHGRAGCATHAPLALHVDAGVSTPAMHVSSAQTVPAG
jgi:hypothetical protein